MTTKLALLFLAVSTPLLLAFLHLWRELGKAKRCADSYRGNDGAPLSHDLRKEGGLLLREMHSFDEALDFAVKSKTMEYFDLGQSLDRVQRRASRSSGLFRPLAGWCLLVGLLITLFNLQSAVGNLSGAFDALSHGPQISSSGDSATGHSREQNVTDKMAAMAQKASSAFRFSFICILVALECGIFAVMLDAKAKEIAATFEQQATVFFRKNLPLLLPMTDARAGERLAEGIGAMKDVVDELRGAALAFRNLQPLVDTMSGVTDSIEAAMRQLPEDLRSSMTNVTSEMVSQLTQTLGESTEYTKKILAIYAEQELRVKSLHAIVNSTQTALAEIKASHQLLEKLPQEIQQLSQSAAAMANSSRDIDAKLAALPVEAMTSAATALLEGKAMFEGSAEQLRSAYLRFNPALAAGITSRSDGNA